MKPHDQPAPTPAHGDLWADLLALLDTLDGLHKATTSGEWRSTWDDPVVNGDDDSQATIETMDPHATGLDKGIVQVLWFNGHHAGCTRENAASIAALHNAYPHLAQALRTALTPTTDGEREAREALFFADRDHAAGFRCVPEPIHRALSTALNLLATERAKAADAARERAAIVAWLREQASEMVKLNQHDDVRLRGAAYLNTARAIERGAHTKVTP